VDSLAKPELSFDQGYLASSFLVASSLEVTSSSEVATSSLEEASS